MNPKIQKDNRRFRSELKDYRDRFIAGINSNHIGKVEESIEIYEVLINTFVKVFNYYKATNLSNKDEKIIEHRLNNIVNWFSEDIYEIFKSGMNSHNIDIILKIDSLTILTAWKGIDIENFDLFQKFIEFKSLFYESSNNETNELKSIIREKIKSHLKETSQFLIINFEKNMYNSPVFFLNSAVYLFKICNSLLEESIIINDLESFKKFTNSSKLLFEYLNLSDKLPRTRDLELSIENSNEKEKEKIEKILKTKLNLEMIEKEIEERQSQMFFGIATFLFEIFNRNKDENDFIAFHSFIDSCLPTDFKNFTYTFLSSHKLGVDFFWGWIFRDLNSNERSLFAGTSGKLEWYYVFRGLKLINRISYLQIKNLEKNGLNYDNTDYIHDLASLVENLTNFLNIIETSKDWKFGLNEDEINCIHIFKKILKKIEKQWKNIEKEKLIKTELSNEKVEIFKKEVLKEFNKKSNLKYLFEFFNSYDYKTNEIKENILRFGINRIEDKRAFIENWHVGYPNLGGEYGNGLSIIDDDAILESLINCCEKIFFSDFEKTLSKLDLSNIFFIITDIEFYKFITESDNFKPSYDIPKTNLDKINGFEGYYVFNEKDIPVFTILGIKSKTFLILEKSKLGTLIQYSPLNKEEKSDLRRNNVYIDIKAFSQNEKLLKRFLDKPPKWLEEKGKEPEQREYLKEHVLIQIFERIQYENDSNAGYSLNNKIKLKINVED